MKLRAQKIILTTILIIFSLGILYSIQIYPKKSYAQQYEVLIHTGSSALVFKEGDEAIAIDRHGNVSFEGTNSSEIINKALTLLTSSRVTKEKIMVLGEHILDTAISLHSYTTFELIGKFTLIDSAEKHPDLIHNADPENGNVQIEVIGGEYDGNKQNQDLTQKVWNYNGRNCLYFSRCEDLVIHKVNAINAGTVGIHVDSSKNVKITQTKIYSPYFHGMHVGHVGAPTEPNENFYIDDLYVEGPQTQPQQERDWDGHALINEYDGGVNYILNVRAPWAFADCISVALNARDTHAPVTLFITNCYVSNFSKTTNLHSDTKRYGILIASSDPQITEVTVTNCIIKNGIGYGIKSSCYSTITGNIIENCNIGLDVLNNTIVDGNLIINTKNGINIQNSNNIISNNIINTTHNDIMIYGEAENNTIIGNELLGKNYSLYQNSGAKNTLITSNKINSKILLNGTYTIQYNSGYVTECSTEFINVVNGSWVPLRIKMSGAPQIVVTTLTTKGYAWVGNRNATHIQLFFNVPIASGSIYCEYIPTMFVEAPIIQHGLIIGVSGSGFTNPPLGTYLYDEGTQTSVTAFPDAGWDLSYWLLNGSNVGSANPYKVTMDADYNLTAVFTESTHVFEDGFESGDFSAWTGTISTSGESSSITTSSHHGAYGAQFTSNGGGWERAYCYKNSGPHNEIFIRAYVKIPQSGITDDGDRHYFVILRSGTVGLAYAGWRQRGGTTNWNIIYKHGTAWVTRYSASIPELDRWYCLELHWVKDSTDGLIELYVDGELAISASGINTAALGDLETIRFGLAEALNCGPTTVLGDCFVASNAYIGP